MFANNVCDIVKGK